MESACLRQTDIPHTSRLFSDFQYHFDRVSRFYGHAPGSPQSYAEAARQIDFPDDRRAALVAALRARNGDSASLDLLAKSGTVAVVTGQQVGLFSGPAYTIYKALTAARLAARLTEQGIPAVPVFWLATEDHDLAEVNHGYVFDRNHNPIALRVDAAGEPQQPVGTIALGHPPLEQLRDALVGFPFAEEVFDLTAAAYQDGASFGFAFEHLLRRLLANWGLLFVDPLDEPVRAIAAPLLRKALERAPELKTRLLDRNKELEAAGYHAQVHIEAQTSLVFVLEGKRRMTLRQSNAGYASKDRKYSVEELAANAAHLSPNALLRPVVQDYMLPTVAYVGGPAELAYLAQSQILYQELLQRMPVMLARSGFTLLDARAAKLLNRHSLQVSGLFTREEVLREHIARRLVPAELTRQFRQVEKAASEALATLRSDLARFDPTLGAALDKSRTKILYQLSKLERKTAREILRRDARATEEAHYLTGLVYPQEHLQERFYSILPFLAKHGLGLLDTLYENVHLDCPDHKILTV
jgi:bacillithiol biosynthesis cysteine-adding enzyme BshC